MRLTLFLMSFFLCFSAQQFLAQPPVVAKRNAPDLFISQPAAKYGKNAGERIVTLNPEAVELLMSRAEVLPTYINLPSHASKQSLQVPVQTYAMIKPGALSVPMPHNGNPGFPLSGYQSLRSQDRTIPMEMLFKNGEALSVEWMEKSRHFSLDPIKGTSGKDQAFIIKDVTELGGDILCGTNELMDHEGIQDSLRNLEERQSKTQPIPTARGPLTVKVQLEADYDMATAGTLSEMANRLLIIVSAGNLIYWRDLGIQLQVTKLVYWTTETGSYPYQVITDEKDRFGYTFADKPDEEVYTRPYDPEVQATKTKLNGFVMHSASTNFWHNYHQQNGARDYQVSSLFVGAIGGPRPYFSAGLAWGGSLGATYRAPRFDTKDENGVTIPSAPRYHGYILCPIPYKWDEVGLEDDSFDSPGPEFSTEAKRWQIGVFAHELAHTLAVKHRNEVLEGVSDGQQITCGTDGAGTEIRYLMGGCNEGTRAMTFSEKSIHEANWYIDQLLDSGKVVYPNGDNTLRTYDSNPFGTICNVIAPDLANVACEVTATAGTPLSGTDGQDVLCGSSGNDTILGKRGNDVIRGGDGNDTIRGSKGFDQIWGGNGNDVIYGERGSDIIYGGNGDDTFYWRVFYRETESGSLIQDADGSDTFYNSGGQDQLIIQNMPESERNISMDGDDTIIDFTTEEGVPYTIRVVGSTIELVFEDEPDLSREAARVSNADPSVDLSPFDQNIQPSEMPTPTTNDRGETNQAYTFDGVNDNLTIHNDPSLNPDDELTVSFRIKLAAYPSSETPILIKGDSAGPCCADLEFGVFLKANGRLVIRHDVGSTVYQADSGVAVPLNDWTHFSGQIDAANGVLTVFLDGVVTNEVTGAGNVNGFESNTYPIRIGEAISGNAFAGSMADLVIYRALISEAKIADQAALGDALTQLGTEGRDALTGTPQQDLLYGLGGDDTILGLEDDDEIHGNRGNDTIRAGKGNDTVWAGKDNDLIYGDLGDDYLAGGEGDDTYVYRRYTSGGVVNIDGVDTIDDIGGNDTLLIEGFAAADITLTQSGSDLVINFAGTTDSITIINHYGDGRIENIPTNTSDPVPTSQAPTAGLALYLRMNGNGTDDSGRGNHGTVVGAEPTHDRFGQLGQALYFDGQDYIEIPNDSSLNPTSSLTLSFWMKRDGYQSAYNWIYHKGGPDLNNDDTNRTYALMMYNNGYLYTYSTGTDNVVNSTNVANGTNAIWMHIAVVIDKANGEQKIWRDGTLIRNNTVPVGIFKTNNNSLRIGLAEELVSGVQAGFKGSLDDVRLYTTALEESDILTLAEDGDYPVADPGGQVLKLTMDNGQAFDDGPYAHSVTAVGVVPAHDRFGQLDKALYFDGQAYLEIPHDASLSPVDQVSVTYWAKRDGYASAYNWIVHKGGEDTENNDFNRMYSLMQYNNGYLYTYVSGDDERVHSTNVANGSNLSWHHIAVVYNLRDEVLQIYRDGTLIRTTSTTVRWFTQNTAALRIGLAEETATNYAGYKGTLDDLRMYNKALTQTEIQAIMGDATPPQPASGQQVLQLNFDGTAVDSSGMNHPITVSGTTPTRNRYGQLGKALYFDGDDYLEIPHHASLSPVDEITVTYWAKRDGYTSAYNWIIHKGGEDYANNDHNRMYSMMQYNNGYLYTYAAGDDEFTHSTNAANGSNASWHHIALVYDLPNETLKIYRNGTIIRNATMNFRYFTQNMEALRIGVPEETGSNFAGYTGALDDFRIYNYALTDAEVAIVAASDESPVETVPASETLYLPLNGPSTGDMSSFNHNVTVSGGQAVRNRYGQMGQAMYFDGDDYIEIPHDASLSPKEAVSVSFWTKRDGYANAHNWVVHKGGTNADASGEDRMYSLSQYNNGYFYTYAAGNDQTTYSTNAVAGGNATWHHIALIYDLANAKVQIYRDGTLVRDTSPNFRWFTQNTHKLRIGLPEETASTFAGYKGALDEFRIHNYALTQAEVTSLMTADAAPTPASAANVLDLPFNGSLNDTSGYGNNGIGSGIGYTTDRFGNPSSALSLDGDDYVRIPHDTTLNPVDQVTLVFWAYRDGYANAHNWIFHKGGPDTANNDQNRMYSLSQYNNGYVYSYLAGDDQSTHSTNAVSGPNQTWHQIAAVFDLRNGVVKIFVDGVLRRNTTTNLRYFTHDTTDLRIGLPEETDTSFSGFKGALDDFRIYNYTLTDQQILDLYNAEKP